MLLGEFHCTTDESGRLSIPSTFCTEFMEGMTLTRGIERCLLGLPAPEWQRLAGRIRAHLPFTNPNARGFARLIFSGALPCRPNQEGSIPLPHALREYAGIEDEAIVIGLSTHVEIWNPQRWAEIRSQLEDGGETIAEQLNEYGV
jgi:MraZ protein